MVRGLDVFKEVFGVWLDQYVLIGGMVVYFSMDEVGLKFCVIKDLDVVLIVEVLIVVFGVVFWDFIWIGVYQVQQWSE